MLNGYHILTLTHRQASLDSIGQAIVRNEAPADTLQMLKARFGWDELLYLATCNRVFYLFYTESPFAQSQAAELLSVVRPDLDTNVVEALAGKMQLYQGAGAVHHLLEVASSMDSLVVGEREIIRQLREAFENCRDWGLTGDHSRLLMRFTVETAKEVYTATGIGEKALSVVALAFNRVLEAGVRPADRILLIGAGQTNVLVAKFLSKYGYQHVTVFNRTLAKAQAVAEYLEGLALPLDALEKHQTGFDAIIACTAATEPIVTPDLYQLLLAGDTDRKVVVDLSVPNNVDRQVAKKFPVEYIEVESLRERARENLKYREMERQKAEVLIQKKVHAFRSLWHERQVERAIMPVVGDVRAAKERALEAVFANEFAALDTDTQELVSLMMSYLEQKSVASAMRTMKAIATKTDRHIGRPSPS